MITRRKFVSLTSVVGLASVLPGMPRAAWAQQANHATARMLVGFTAGGAIDVVARMLVDGMKDYFPSFIVDNRPGAGGRFALGALMGGRIAATIYPTGTALPYVQSGAIRALATTGPQRSPLLPDVPTVREAGYPMLEANEWFGVFVPAMTPAETVNRLNGAIRSVVSTDAFKANLAKLSVDAAGITPEEFAQLIKSDFKRWEPIVQASGFSVED